MRNPNPKKQNVRTTGAPVADASRLNRALTPDYTKIDSTATVCVGRDLLGFLVDGPGHCVALSADRKYIGTFSNRREASLAILLERRKAAPA
jgi:hypothetical protein